MPAHTLGLNRRLAGGLSLLALATLTACGGGGSSDSPATPSGSNDLARYAGTWVGDCVADQSRGGLMQSQWVITQTGASAVRMTASTLRFASDSLCMGTPTSVVANHSEDDAYQGTKSIDGVVVDKFIATTSTGTDKFVTVSDGDSLYVEDEESTRDAEGYATVLYPHVAMHRKVSGANLLPFLGMWTSDCLPDGDRFQRVSAMIDQLDGQQVFITASRQTYADNDCAGTPTTSTNNMAMTYTGTMTIDGKTVSKFTDSDTGQTRSVYRVDGDALYGNGVRAVSIGTPGQYPTTLSTLAMWRVSPQ